MFKHTATERAASYQNCIKLLLDDRLDLLFGGDAFQRDPATGVPNHGIQVTDAEIVRRIEGFEMLTQLAVPHMV